ncbi:MAG: N-6 DNA methylase [Nanopusillaceae archaeon]
MDTLVCLIRNKEVKATPEELVRQEFIRRLIEEWGYPKEHIDVEVPIVSGHGEIKDVESPHKPKRADIVVYHNASKAADDIYIVVEVKKKRKEAGEQQAKSYGNASTAEVVVWHNGEETRFWQRKRKPSGWIERLWLPRYGQTYDDKLLRKGDLIPARNLSGVFQRVHNKLYATGKSANKVKLFYQIVYLLFAKIEDELSEKEECDFVLYPSEEEAIREGKEPAAFQSRINNLFERAKKRKQFKEVFDDGDAISLEVRQIADVVSELEQFALLGSDAKGEAFQAFLSAHFRGESGQFFTPDPVKKMVVEMLRPPLDGVVLDPACGSGGFLIFTLQYWKDLIKKKYKLTEGDGTPTPDAKLTREQLDLVTSVLKLHAKDYIRGVDFDNDLTKLSKMYMVLVDDGHTGIFTADALQPMPDLESATKGEVKEGSARIILTNPPFGTKGKVTTKAVLREYDLAYKWKRTDGGSYIRTNDLMDGVPPDILFVERVYQLLEPGGIASIVLPLGDLTNANTAHVRFWLKERAQVLGVIKLPDYTFVPYGAGVSSAILIFRKPSGRAVPSNYPIFFADVQQIGYDQKGRPTYKRKGGFVVDEFGEPVGFKLKRRGLGERRDRKNYPLNDDGEPLPVYYDADYRRLYLAKGGVPVDKNGNPVPHWEESGRLVFRRDEKGRILGADNKVAPHDEFSTDQDPHLIARFGAIDDQTPLAVKAWHIFFEALAEGGSDWASVDEKLGELERREGLVSDAPSARRVFFLRTSGEIFGDPQGLYRLDPEYWQPRYRILDIGERPQGTVKLLKEIATFANGSTPRGSNYVPCTEGVPFFRVADLRRLSYGVESEVCISRHTHTKKLARSQLSHGDVLFSITGRIGSVAFVTGEGNISQHIVRVRLSSEGRKLFLPEYLALYLASDLVRLFIEREMYGSTRPALPLRAVQNIPVPVIPLEEQKELVEAWLESERLIAQARNREEALLRQVKEAVFAPETAWR